MPDQPVFDTEAIVDAMAPLLGLNVKPEYRVGIATNLKVTAAFAALVLDETPDDHTDPAAVFQA